MFYSAFPLRITRRYEAARRLEIDIRARARAHILHDANYIRESTMGAVTSPRFAARAFVRAGMKNRYKLGP